MRISYWSSDVCSSDLLVVDPNRGLDNPTLMPEVSDGTVVPGNRALGAAERRARVDTFYHPYHAALAAKLDELLAAGRAPALVSMHPFTPVLHGVARPLEVGLSSEEAGVGTEVVRSGRTMWRAVLY